MSLCIRFKLNLQSHHKASGKKKIRVCIIEDEATIKPLRD